MSFTVLKRVVTGERYLLHVVLVVGRVLVVLSLPVSLLVYLLQKYRTTSFLLLYYFIVVHLLNE